MAALANRAAFIAAVLALAACSGPDPLYSGDTAQAGRSAVSQTSLGPQGYSAAGAPVTYVGRKAQELRSDLDRLNTQVAERRAMVNQLRASTLENSQRYYATVAAINSRLQIGSTPGNPILAEQWNQAQGHLDRVYEDIAKMNRLSSQIASDSAMAGYLLEAIRAAFSLSGAVEDDHRMLAILQDDVSRSSVSIERLLTEIGDDVARQTAYVGSERRNLTAMSVAIKNGELYGGALAPRAGLATPYNAPSVAAPGRPLVTIKFDRANPQFQQALYAAVSQALDRRPDARFDIVGVGPARGSVGGAAITSNSVRRNAESVARALGELGLSSQRINLTTSAQPGLDVNEVQVFVR